MRREDAAVHVCKQAPDSAGTIERSGLRTRNTKSGTSTEGYLLGLSCSSLFFDIFEIDFCSCRIVSF
ncbi:unnamed protein product [Amoebophrya sp. A25]|nr:unnamed protein product [Amoebophrya sp. A25]|eukprot:GSA25T00018920001.1